MFSVSKIDANFILQSKEGSDSDYEQEQERLEEIEAFLSQHDLEFSRFFAFTFIRSK